VIRIRSRKATADSIHKFNIAPDFLDHNFTADGLNQKWAGGITYIWTREGWLSLAVILNLHCQRGIGYVRSRQYRVSTAGHRLRPLSSIPRIDCGATFSNRMKRDLAIRAE
jgi:transposase InsO family protein